MSRYCIGCGYMLDHLTEPRCPECGRAFSPDDPLTSLPDLFNRGRRALFVSLGGIGAMLLSLVFAGEFGRTAAPGEWNGFGYLYIACLLGGYVIQVAVFFYSSFVILRRRPFWGRRAMHAAWAISFLFGFVFPLSLFGLSALGLLPRE